MRTTSTPTNFRAVVCLDKLSNNKDIKVEHVPPPSFFIELQDIGLYDDNYPRSQLGIITTYSKNKTNVYISGHLTDEGVTAYNSGCNKIGLAYETLTMDQIVTFSGLNFILCKSCKLDSKMLTF